MITFFELIGSSSITGLCGGSGGPGGRVRTLIVAWSLLDLISDPSGEIGSTLIIYCLYPWSKYCLIEKLVYIEILKMNED